MPLDPDEFHARVQAEAGLDGRLPPSRMTGWEVFPFEPDGLRVVPLAPPELPEAPRSGDDPADCLSCRPGRPAVWSDDSWRVRLLEPSGAPLVLMVSPHAHLDLTDLPDERAAELGRLLVHLARAVEALPHVARAHLSRWGDGGAHLHVFVYARPEGFAQLRGTCLALWDDLLPPVPDDVRDADAAAVARALVASYGGRASDASAPAELVGEQVRLVPVVAEHVPELRRILLLPEVRERWGDEAASPAWPFDEPEETRYAVVVDGAVRGMVQYGEEPDPDYRSSSIDVFLDPQVHGGGLGRDAVGTVVRHLVHERGHHRVTIDPALDNVAAIRAYAAVGFRPVGVMRGYERLGDEEQAHDNLLMDLLASDLAPTPRPRPGPPDAVMGAELDAALADLPGWRAVDGALHAVFRMPTAADALALVAAVGRAAEDADHHPDVDWRYDRVLLRTTTHQAGNAVTSRDLDLAARSSTLAAACGGRAEPVG